MPLVIGFVETGACGRTTCRRHRQERATFERKLGIMRRTVLAFDLLLFGGLGYWIGDADRRLRSR